MEDQPAFIANIQATYKEVGKKWLEQLSSHVAQLAKLWDFRLIRELPALSYSYVALVELNTTKEQVIFKMAPPGSNIITEAKWLMAFHHRVPRIFKIDEEQHAFLMEHLRPGKSVKAVVKSGEDDKATRIICQTILELHRDQPPFSSYKHLIELIPDLSQLKGSIDNRLLSKAQSLFADLSCEPSNDVLLHGDLHHDNILSSGSSWKVIDPHGYIGDAVAEVGPMIHNPFDCFPEEPFKKVIDSRLKILCEMLPYDPKRIQAWAFCITVLSAAWDFEADQKVNHSKIEKAKAIDSFKL